MLIRSYIEFLGRKDRQVKITGHRVELEEVDIFALSLGAIEESFSCFDSRKELVYLFYKGGIDEKELIILFRQSLPTYMVPRRVVKVDDWPRLPNGKTDVKELEKRIG